MVGGLVTEYIMLVTMTSLELEIEELSVSVLLFLSCTVFLVFESRRLDFCC